MLDRTLTKFKCWALILMSAASIGLSACGGGGSAESAPTPTPDPQPEPPLSGRPLAEAALRSVLDMPGMIIEAQVYAMFTITGDLVTSDPDAPLTGTRNCISGGTHTLVLNDTNGDQQISEGESADITLSDCYGFTSEPANGNLFQELISFDAVFPPGSIFASTINTWYATYTYTNFTRTDANDGTQYSYNGDLTFDYQRVGSGDIDIDFTLSSNRIELKANATELTLENFSYRERPNPNAIDSKDVSISGTLYEPNVGKMDVLSGIMSLNAVSTDQPYFSGFMSITNGIVNMDFTFNSDGSVTVNMGGDIWMFTP